MRVISKFCIIGFCLTALYGCFSSYEAPLTRPADIVDSLQASKAEIYEAARSVLKAEGYKLTNYFMLTGSIATAPKLLDMDETECDCGMVKGFPIIRDKFNKTYLTLSFSISDKKIIVHSVVNGYYEAYSFLPKNPVDCVSTGKIENDLIEKIRTKLKAK